MLLALIVEFGSEKQVLYSSDYLMRQNNRTRVEFPNIFRFIERNKLILGICVVSTKTIIHLSVVESGGYLPCRSVVL